MRILFDHNAPQGLRAFLPNHSVTLARHMGWEELVNGELLKVAEESGFELLLTTDRRIRYQQNMSGRKIALVVITGTTKWPRVKVHGARIAEAVDAAGQGSYVEIFVPHRLD